MMPEVVQELAAGKSVAVANLFEFQFASSTVRFWNGLGSLVAGGRTWQGSGALISVSGVTQSGSMAATAVTFTLSGSTPDLVSAAINGESEVTGRPVTIYHQFLSDRVTALDEPIALWAGRMDQMSFSADVSVQTISLSAESLWVNRVRTNYDYWTDTGQRARWPDDPGLEFAASLQDKTVNWLFN